MSIKMVKCQTRKCKLEFLQQPVGKGNNVRYNFFIGDKQVAHCPSCGAEIKPDLEEVKNVIQCVSRECQRRHTAYLGCTDCEVYARYKASETQMGSAIAEKWNELTAKVKRESRDAVLAYANEK